MRKKSREKDSQWALEVMTKAPYITVSFTREACTEQGRSASTEQGRSNGTAYGVPLSLAHKVGDPNIWYFHCATEGAKLDALKAHPEVCLSAVTKCVPTVGPLDGSFTMVYRSAIAFGKAEIVTDDSEKIEALRAICLRFLPRHMDAFDTSIARSLSRTTVVRITLNEPPTGKHKEFLPDGTEDKKPISHSDTNQVSGRYRAGNGQISEKL